MAILKSKVVQNFNTRHNNFTMLKTKNFPFKLFYEKKLKEEKMNTKKETIIYDVISDNLALMSKIYQSFEALEQALGDLQMEEALFMTYAAKKSFANTIAKHDTRHYLKH